MTTIRPGRLGLLEARERSRGGGVDRIDPVQPVLKPGTEFQPSEDPGPSVKDSPERARERMKIASAQEQARRGSRQEPEQSGRDLRGPQEALQPSASPGPLDVRYDSGIFFHYDMGHALEREALTGAFTGVSGTLTTGASSQAIITFDIEEDHYLLGTEIEVLSGQANIVRWALWARPQVGQSQVLIVGRDGANSRVLPLTGAADRELLVPDPDLARSYPLFMRDEALYSLVCENDAGGSSEIRSRIHITRAPVGVPIPH